MEIEENRGFIDKKSYENQWVSLVSSILELSHYSIALSHSWTLRVFLDTLELEQERQRIQEEAKIKQGKARSSSYNMIHFRYRFACVLSLLYFASMVLHVVLFYHGMGFSRCDSVLQSSLSISR